ncbi:MAG: hypothetical protein WDA10_08285 [Porticoccaceae bacterium]
MRGGCRCGNIQLDWRSVDLSIVPRACACDFCRTRSVLWVGKAGTEVRVLIRMARHHRVLTQGTGTARFHECGHCDTLVLASCGIDGLCHGVLNANCLVNPAGFAAPVPLVLADEPLAERLERRRRNWCCPVLFDVVGP